MKRFGRSTGRASRFYVFTTGTGHVQIVLSNQFDADVIRSVGQAVSDLAFSFSNNAGAVGTTSASGQQGGISSSGVVTYGSGLMRIIPASARRDEPERP